MISQVLWNRRPPNDKLIMCGSVFADVRWPTNDDIIYPVWKQNKETRDFLVITEVIDENVLLPHWTLWFTLTLSIELVLSLWSPPLCWPLHGCVLHFGVLDSQTLAGTLPPDMREQVGPLEFRKRSIFNSKLQHVLNTCQKTAPVLLFMGQNFQAFAVWPHQGI